MSIDTDPKPARKRKSRAKAPATLAPVAETAPAVLTRVAKASREARTNRKRGTATDASKRQHKAAVEQLRSDVGWLGRVTDPAELAAALRSLADRADALAAK